MSVSHVTNNFRSHVACQFFFKKTLSHVTKMSMSSVEFKKVYCRCVEFEKRPCRLIDFRGLDP